MEKVKVKKKKIFILPTPGRNIAATRLGGQQIRKISEVDKLAEPYFRKAHEMGAKVKNLGEALAAIGVARPAAREVFRQELRVWGNVPPEKIEELAEERLRKQFDPYFKTHH